MDDWVLWNRRRRRRQRDVRQARSRRDERRGLARRAPCSPSRRRRVARPTTRPWRRLMRRLPRRNQNRRPSRRPTRRPRPTSTPRPSRRRRTRRRRRITRRKKPARSRKAFIPATREVYAKGGALNHDKLHAFGLDEKQYEFKQKVYDKVTARLGDHIYGGVAPADLRDIDGGQKNPQGRGSARSSAARRAANGDQVR